MLQFTPTAVHATIHYDTISATPCNPRTGPRDLDCVANGAADVRVRSGWESPVGDIGGLLGDVSSGGSINNNPENYPL